MEINDDMPGTTVEVNKCGIIVVKGLRMITTATVMEIQRGLKKMNIDVSCGSIWKFLSPSLSTALPNVRS